MGSGTLLSTVKNYLKKKTKKTVGVFLTLQDLSSVFLLKQQQPKILCSHVDGGSGGVDICAECAVALGPRKTY